MLFNIPRCKQQEIKAETLILMFIFWSHTNVFSAQQKKNSLIGLAAPILSDGTLFYREALSLISMCPCKLKSCGNVFADAFPLEVIVLAKGPLDMLLC